MSVVSLILALAGPMTPASHPPKPAPILQSANRDVPVGDPQRRVLLDTIRPTLQRDVGQPVQFVVDTLRIRGDWAFYAGRIQQPNGRPIDFSRTRYAELIAQDVFDGPTTYAVLRRTGGTWRLVDFVVGPTDVAYLNWPDDHGAPLALFQ